MKASLIVGLFLTAFLWAGDQPKTTNDVLIFTNVNVVGMRDGEIAQGVTRRDQEGADQRPGQGGLCRPGPEHSDRQCPWKIPDPGTVGHACAQRVRFSRHGTKR